MATFSRPGVYIQEVPLPQNVGQSDITSAAGAFVGALPKGPTAPTLVTNWTDFVKTFGNLSDSYPTTWAAYNFFANGGRQLYVRRVVLANAAAGSVIFNDGTGSTLTGTVTAASASAGTITYTANNGFSVGQTVSVSGLTGTVAITAISGSGTVVTYSTASTTGLSVGQSIVVAGATTTAYNGTWTIASVTANTNFTVTSTVTGATSTATGTYSSLFNITGTIGTVSSTQFTITSAVTDRAVSGATGTANVTIASNNVFTLTASNAGSWSSSLSAQVVPAGTPTRFGLNIYSTTTQNGASTTVLLESYTDLSVTSTDKNYVVSVVNSYSSVATATLVASIVPSTSAVSASPFTGASDGTGTLARSDYSVWSSFDPYIQPLVLYAADAPYQAATLSGQMHADAVVYAAGRADCFAVVDTPAGLGSLSAAQTQITAISALFAGSTAGGVAAAYWPWYSIPDGTKTAGATRLQAPGAGVVGQYLNTDATRGPAKTPAGLQNNLALAVSTERLFTNAELDSMNTSVDPINPIRQVPGAGIVIMGGRTMDNTPNNRYINIRRSLIYIENALNALTSFALFENNDSILWNKINVIVGNFLRSYWQGGNLRGGNPDQAFFVKCDSSTTSFSDIQAGRVNIQVGVALQYPAEFVIIQIGQLTGNATA